MIDLERRLAECQERAKSNTHRIDEMEKRQNDLSDLVGTVKVLASREERVEEDVKEIKTEVKKINDKPAKRWETLVTQIISVLAAAAVGFVLAKIGLGG